MNAPFPHRVGERLMGLDNVCVSYGRPVLRGPSACIDNTLRDDIA